MAVFTQKVLARLHPESSTDSHSSEEEESSVSQSVKRYTVAPPPPGTNLSDLANTAVNPKCENSEGSSSSDSDDQTPPTKVRRKRRHGKRVSTVKSSVPCSEESQIVEPEKELSGEKPADLTKNKKRKLKKKRRQARLREQKNHCKYYYRRCHCLRKHHRGCRNLTKNCKGSEAKRCKTNVLSPNSACDPVSSKSDCPQSDTPGFTLWKDSNCVVDESADGKCLGCSARKLSDPSPQSDSGLENSPDLSFHSSGVKTVKDMECRGSFKNGNSSNAEGGFPSESGRERTSLKESYLDDDPSLTVTCKSVENNLPSGGTCPETNSETQQSCLPDSGRGRAQTQKLNFGDDVSAVKSSDSCQPSVSGEAGLTLERQYVHVDPDTQSSHASVIPNGDFSSLLPREVFLTILSYLTPRELARYVAPVCKRWREVSKDPILWQTLELDTVSSVFMCRLVRDFPLLRTLLIRGRWNFTVPEAMVLTDFCQNLEELDLGFTQNIDVHRLEPFVEKCPKLRSLNIEGCCQVDGAAVRVLVKATRLQRLNLSHCVKLVDEDVILLVDCLPKITQLNVDEIASITDVSVTRLVSLHGPHLTHLSLDGEELTDISLHAISQCSNLRQLSISFCGALTDDCLVSLKCLVHLRRLCLRKGEGFTSEGLCDAFSGTELSQLTHLNISECTNIGDEAILSIVQCCGMTLKEFLLDWCWYISDVGLTSIIDHCRSLCVLSLVGVKNLLGDALDRIPEDIPTLTRLELQGVNMIDDALVLDLVSLKADLKIVNYYGEEIIHGGVRLTPVD